MNSAAIKTPVTKDPNGAFTVEEIPLPPPEMWTDLDNSEDSQTGIKPPEAPKADARASRVIEQLNFGGADRRVVPLNFPFDHPDYGRVTEITVRRLSVGEVGELIDNLPKGQPDNFWIYARQTGFAEEVLRGLVDIDGEAVTDVCFDFLPRVFAPNRSGS